MAGEWRSKCKDCRYSKKFGMAPVTAATKATTHALTNKHRVDVFKDNVWQFTTGSEVPGQLSLFE